MSRSLGVTYTTASISSRCAESVRALSVFDRLLPTLKKFLEGSKGVFTRLVNVSASVVCIAFDGNQKGDEKNLAQFLQLVRALFSNIFEAGCNRSPIRFRHSDETATKLISSLQILFRKVRSKKYTTSSLLTFLSNTCDLTQEHRFVIPNVLTWNISVSCQCQGREKIIQQINLIQTTDADELVSRNILCLLSGEIN